MTEESLKLHNSRIILSKDQFLDLNASAAVEMSQDHSLQKQVKEFLSGSKKVLVILASFHTHENVLNELHAYSYFIGKDQYF